MFDLTGRRALVTGSSRGIGQAIATALADAGAGVAVHARAPSEALQAVEDTLRASGATVVAVTGDLAVEGEAAAIVDAAAEALGGLEILVNNAGVASPASADELDGPTWDAVVDVNLRAAFFAAQAAARHMRAAGVGRIVNISSQAAEAAIPGYVNYGVSKAGLNILARYLASEWAADGITVNTVSPAFVRTELAAQVFAQLPELYEDQLARIPKRRMCSVEEVAAAVLYLASDEADFTTGETLHVDGGYLAL